MQIIKPYVLVDTIYPENIMKLLEYRGRVCYKSENRITEDSAKDFIAGIIRRGHESVLEHEKISVRFIIDRGVSHEIVRHRAGASYSQESTRYCDYADGHVTFIIPYWVDSNVKEGVYEEYEATPDDATNDWLNTMWNLEDIYTKLRVRKWQPQQVRTVLPNSLKTEVETTYNLREWRHFFQLRAAATAHPQMQQVTIPLLLHLQERLPVLFGDIDFNREFPIEHYAKVWER